MTLRSPSHLHHPVSRRRPTTPPSTLQTRSPNLTLPAHQSGEAPSNHILKGGQRIMGPTVSRTFDGRSSESRTASGSAFFLLQHQNFGGTDEARSPTPHPRRAVVGRGPNRLEGFPFNVPYSMFVPCDYRPTHAARLHTMPQVPWVHCSRGCPRIGHMQNVQETCWPCMRRVP